MSHILRWYFKLLTNVLAQCEIGARLLDHNSNTFVGIEERPSTILPSSHLSPPQIDEQSQYFLWTNNFCACYVNLNAVISFSTLADLLRMCWVAQWLCAVWVGGKKSHQSVSSRGHRMDWATKFPGWHLLVRDSPALPVRLQGAPPGAQARSLRRLKLLLAGLQVPVQR